MASENNQSGISKSCAVRADDAFMPGFVLDGRFEIISPLGRGGMCSVFKARHLDLHKDVAVKVLHSQLILDKDAVARFHREGPKAISVLDHPNIVKVYGFGCFNETSPYMAMEYLEGRSLAAILKDEHRLSQQRALPIFRQLLDALAHAHAKGIIHRDLKPSNVMLQDNGATVKLVDFGIAKILPESGQEMQRLTQTGQLFGTVMYMSPEQCQCDPLDARSDVYSVGCLMYETLDGQPPFVGDTPYSTIAKHLHESPKESPYLTDDIGAVVYRALEKLPALEPHRAIELQQALLEPANHRNDYRSRNRFKKLAITRRPMGLVLTVLAVVAVVLTTLLQVHIHGQDGDGTNVGQSSSNEEKKSAAQTMFVRANAEQYRGDTEQDKDALDSVSQFWKSIEHYTQCITLDSLFADAYYGRANSYNQLLNTPLVRRTSTAAQLKAMNQSMIDDFARFLKLMPPKPTTDSFRKQYVQAYRKCSVGLSIERRYAETIAACDGSIGLDTDSRIGKQGDYTNRANANWELGNYQASINDCTEALRLVPDGYEAFEMRAQAYASLGQHQQAISDLGQYILRFPERPHAYSQRAQEYEKIGKLDLAQRDRETAERLERGR